MARQSRFRSAFGSTGVLLALLLAGCGPVVEEERDDDFIERQCERSCERLDDCGRRSADCLEVCTELVTWEPLSCEEVTADYLRCVRDLTCEEIAARAEPVDGGAEALAKPCYDESFATAICAN